MKVAIIGAGIAGTAAAFEFARHGERATVFHAATGASGLYSGALDFELWDPARSPQPVSAELASFSTELGVWALDSAPCRVATLEGNVRAARGADRALLDLERCAGKRVALIDIERDDWDARLLARSFAESAWAQQTHTQFQPVSIRALHHGFERRISAYDFAALHDVPERADSLAAALAAGAAEADAWLLGPWLGIERPLAQELSARLGLPVGETSSAPGGAAGARFESARDRLLARCANVERTAVVRLVANGAGYRLETTAAERFDFDAVLIASGGVAAGGVVLERAFERRGGTGFGLSFSAPFSLELDGEPLEGVSSLSGFDFVERGLDALLELGIGTQTDGALRGHPGLFAAGDVAAGKPCSALRAANSALIAARALLDFGHRSR